MNRSEAFEIYNYLRQVASHPILDALGFSREPHDNRVRTRPWKDGKPRGIAFHYTGGANGLRTMGWFNSPKYDNKVSSAQVLIFDRIPDNIIGRIWSKLDSRILKLFPVPTVILADWLYSTWCTNWMNEYCMGVENRNMGNAFTYEFHRKLNKPANSHGGYYYECYSREQLICNINLGRVVRGYSYPNFNRDYCVGHHMIRVGKSDPGPAFPLKQISDAIFTNQNVTELQCIKTAFSAPTNSPEPVDFTPPSMDKRDNYYLEALPTIKPSVIRDPFYLCNLLARLGFNTAAEIPPATTLRMFTEWFQHSTRFYADRKKRLKIDGIAGPKTFEALKQRVWDLGLYT
jgi:hypothetical protein